MIEGFAVTGSFSTGYVQQFPNPDQGQAVDIDCTANIGSYDPNDKQGMPIGYGYQPLHQTRHGPRIPDPLPEYRHGHGIQHRRARYLVRMARPGHRGARREQPCLPV